MNKMVETMLHRDRFAQLCGMEMVKARDGESIVRMPIKDCHLNALDMVHGGAIFAMADYAFALACNSKNPPSVALSVNIQFLKPGVKGVLQAHARELCTSGRVATYLVEVRDEADEILASFQGLSYIKTSK